MGFDFLETQFRIVVNCFANIPQFVIHGVDIIRYRIKMGSIVTLSSDQASTIVGRHKVKAQGKQEYMLRHGLRTVDLVKLENMRNCEHKRKSESFDGVFRYDSVNIMQMLLSLRSI